MQPTVDLPSAVSGQSIICGDIVPQKQDIAQCSQNQTKRSNNPNDQSEQHAEKDRCLLLIVVGKNFEVDKELRDSASTFLWSVFSYWHKIRLHH